MKLFLLTCLLASALAAPSDKIKRNVLPGDARYDAQHHNEPDQSHKHQENADEIAKALSNYNGCLSPLALTKVFGTPEFKSEIPSSFQSNPNFPTASFTAIPQQSAVVQGSPDIKSVKAPTGQVHLPVGGPAPNFQSKYVLSPDPAFNPAAFGAPGKFNPQFSTFPLNASPGQVALVQPNSNVRSYVKPTSNEGGATAGSSATQFQSRLGSQLNTGIGAQVNPQFSSLPATAYYNPNVATFEQVRYTPNFDSVSAYNPALNGYNANYQQYSNGAEYYPGYQLAPATYSGFEQALKGKTVINPYASTGFPQQYTLENTKNVQPEAYPQDYQIRTVNYPLPQPAVAQYPAAVPQARENSINLQPSRDQPELAKNLQRTDSLVQPTTPSFEQPAVLPLTDVKTAQTLPEPPKSANAPISQ